MPKGELNPAGEGFPSASLNDRPSSSRRARGAMRHGRIVLPYAVCIIAVALGTG
jgi:hypothetical protein